MTDSDAVTEDARSRVDALDSWHSEWGGLRVAVLGLGITGFSVADTLIELGAEVLVFSGGHDHHRAELLQVIGAGLVERDLSSGDTDDLRDFAPELVVASPGFAPGHPLLLWAESAGVTVWGDVELAWRVRDKVGAPAEWIVVTGAEGAAETALLAEAMLLRGGFRALACGDLGVPVLDAVRAPIGWDVLVVELSGRQLHYARSLSPWASICVSSGADDAHPPWHESAEHFVASMAKAYNNTRTACVFNRADAATITMVEEADVVEGARAIGFGLGVPGPSDFGVIDGILCDRAFLDDRHATALEITTVSDLVPVGLASPTAVTHVLAAAALARSFGVPIEAVRDALMTYSRDDFVG